MLEIIILAVIQGLTEFLPISSSGHLNLLSYFMTINKEELLLVFLILHAGTAFSAICFFWEDIQVIILGLWDFVCRRSSENAKDSLQWIALILCISLPTAIIGISFKSTIEVLGQNFLFLAMAWFSTAIILWFTKFHSQNQETLHTFSYKKAFLVGLAQSFAIMPGVSRSGSTIAMAMFLGASPKFAGRLSFLASFVTIFGALLLEVLDLFKQQNTIEIPLLYLFIGFIASFLVGWVALKFLMKLLTHGKLYIFSIYCFLLSCSVFVLYFVKLG